MSFNFTKDRDDELKRKFNEVRALAHQLQQLGIRIEDIEGKISKTCDEISLIEMKKERIAKRFLLLR